jgi:hypothetical protein
MAASDSGPKMRAATALLAGVTAGGVALARLFLDEHWLDDIVGGWLAGVAIGIKRSRTEYVHRLERHCT